MLMLFPLGILLLSLIWFYDVVQIKLEKPILRYCLYAVLACCTFAAYYALAFSNVEGLYLRWATALLIMIIGILMIRSINRLLIRYIALFLYLVFIGLLLLTLKNAIPEGPDRFFVYTGITFCCVVTSCIISFMVPKREVWFAHLPFFILMFLKLYFTAFDSIRTYIARH